MKEKKVKKSKKLKLKILISVILIAVISFTSLSIYYVFSQKAKKNYELYIYPNTKYENIINELATNGVISNKFIFNFISYALKYPELIKEGRYVIKTGESYVKIIRKLRSGAQTPIKLVIPSKRKLNSLLQYISKHFLFSYTELKKELDKGEFYDSTEFNEYTILGLFIPNTYEFYWNSTPDKFLRKMYKHYNNFWKKNSREKKAKELGFSRIEVIILASIVQEETNIRSEYKTIAGVYINRLRKGMKLQADPTVRFALQNFGLRRVLLKHLKYDSPYNTYKYHGLPPGPINNPYPYVIDAVLNYEKHNYLFFCASPKLDGTHLFAKTYAEHKRNANKYQSILNKRKIFK